ncbi:cytochrome b/b6 domain-containing protein [Thiomicrospira pelophila]|uniref:cytochrome b/b6 domain-containing protein n=1 Tax=Thiomicrospira pelophila TaxID=934 RepID=UPI0005701609|nr:cytochrome b/b6 domain-containing protein [Thiomicrospira pelophila]
MKESLKTLVWDLPVRLFHWLLVIGFFTAAFISLVLGDDSGLFAYHAILGLIIGLMVFMRVIWGFVGSRYARFSSFTYGPKSVLQYIGGALIGRDTRHVGHNPAGAWAIFAMLGLLVGLVLSGLLMGLGLEFIEDIHELFAYAMLAVVAVHILGVIAHVVRHRENIVASMYHGRKAVDEKEGIKSPHFVAAFVFCVVCVSWGYGLFANFDAATQTTKLPLVGWTVQVGEVEHEHDDHDDDH